MSRLILFLINFILRILSFMCCFCSKCLLMLINCIFIYFSINFIYILHTHTCKGGHESDIQSFGGIRDLIHFVRIINYSIRLDS